MDFVILHPILWYHSTCGAAGWGGLGAPDARRSTGSGHAIANVLGAGVQLYGDCLDSAHGLVAVGAARVVSRSRLVVIEKSRLAAAGCAAHAGKAPMHRRLEAPDSDDIWASSVDLEFKMDSSWKLAEWRRTRTLRLVSTCTATSTWKRELRVRADCGASEPQALAAGGGGRLRKHIMRAICRGHLWGVEKCTISRPS